MASVREVGPGVRVPPPLVFVVGYVAAWWLNRRLEFTISRQSSAIQESVGLVVMAAGLVVAATAMATFARWRTAIVPLRRARALVISGPYRFSRNPMYVGLSLAYLGLAVLMNQAWPIVLLPVVLVTVTLAIIRREERYLHDEFGPAYDDYCRRVRRFL